MPQKSKVSGGVGPQSVRSDRSGSSDVTENVIRDMFVIAMRENSPAFIESIMNVLRDKDDPYGIVLPIPNRPGYFGLYPSAKKRKDITGNDLQAITSQTPVMVGESPAELGSNLLAYYKSAPPSPHSQPMGETSPRPKVSDIPVGSWDSYQPFRERMDVGGLMAIPGTVHPPISRGVEFNTGDIPYGRTPLDFVPGNLPRSDIPKESLQPEARMARDARESFRGIGTVSPLMEHNRAQELRQYWSQTPRWPIEGGSR